MSLPIPVSYPVNTVNYKHLFHECPVPMYLFDTETFQIIEANTSALIQYGYIRKEFIGLSVFNIRPEEDISNFIQTSRDLPAGFYDAGRWRHMKKNGKVFYVQVYSHKTKHEGKDTVLALAINIDAQVENEMRLNEMVQQLEKQNNKLQYFSWLNSHKIRNQVANILGLTELYNAEETDEHLKATVIKNIETCAKLLDEVLREIAKDIK